MDIIAQPLGALLRLIYQLVGNYGLSIILFTIVVKLIMVPLTIKQTKSMKKMQEVQPKIKEIQEKYKNDKEKMNTKVMELYKEYNVSPFGGCLPLLIQFPIIIGLFSVLRNPLDYGFAQEVVEAGFLWLPSLSQADPLILPLLAGLTTYLSSATMTSAGGKQDPTQNMMKYFFPVMIFIWGRSFPSGLTLYWVVSNVFQVVQQVIINKPYSQIKEGSN
ncbi:membrane protein insertase YidC/Oxa1 family [Clostridium aceticum]|uniref:Membrane protein insertase YidC/Oxa1 family n=1 Tax=Clostridium aceticum TaxID=84022 RepID=A0A0D8I8K6_9CLOT|nr:YidC/Oxa1 family membrane protein insertase [Clostridium aceticum]AKL97372.1 membrane protein insertase YidC/Oxa1 family [Clostridium aceticum]KJF26379.1 sporulation protein [Clostridium aceticum]